MRAMSGRVPNRRCIVAETLAGFGLPTSHSAWSSMCTPISSSAPPNDIDFWWNVPHVGMPSRRIASTSTW